jgi:predicted dinucleotide-binding enzyme
MRVGVLGSGMVGRAVASRLVELGHEVRMGSRDASGPAAGSASEEGGPREWPDPLGSVRSL